MKKLFLLTLLVVTMPAFAASYTVYNRTGFNVSMQVDHESHRCIHNPDSVDGDIGPNGSASFTIDWFGHCLVHPYVDIKTRITTTDGLFVSGGRIRILSNWGGLWMPTTDDASVDADRCYDDLFCYSYVSYKGNNVYISPPDDSN